MYGGGHAATHLRRLEANIVELILSFPRHGFDDSTQSLKGQGPFKRAHECAQVVL